MTAFYRIHAKDPGGQFVEADWRTRELPRKGEQVLLPDGSELPEGGPALQELEVVEVAHPPGGAPPDVWLGGTDGWEPGSVAHLFELALDHGTRSTP